MKCPLHGRLLQRSPEILSRLPRNHSPRPVMATTQGTVSLSAEHVFPSPMCGKAQQAWTFKSHHFPSCHISMFAQQPPNLSVTYECRHLIALSIHFPTCRMGTTLLGQKGRGVSAECFEVCRGL